jgi:hypothetical protein
VLDNKNAKNMCVLLAHGEGGHGGHPKLAQMSERNWMHTPNAPLQHPHHLHTTQFARFPEKIGPSGHKQDCD